MSNDLVVRGGTIITAADRFVADVGIRAGRIVEIGESLPRASQEIDAAGLQVLPGGVDVHTHLDVDVGTVHTADDFESGTAAAACGGITTICDYAWQRRGQTIGEAIRTWQAKACDKAHIDYGFHVILSEVSIGDHAFLRLLGAARTAGALVNVHAENGDMIDHVAREMVVAGRHDPRYYAESRPALAEAEATQRAIMYAELTDAEIYIVHLSCRDALEAVRAARKRGARVWAETRPIYLALTDERYRAGGTEAAKVVGAPPLRSAADQAALWDGLRSGDIQVIGSDNTSWTVQQNAAGADDFTRVPYGVPGLETEMQVIYSEGVSKGRMSVHTFVGAFATNPARIFGLYPKKGTIAVGSDADLVLFDPARTRVLDERRLHSRAGYDPFHGLEVRGVPVLTLSRGEIVARDGQLLSRPGRGQHLKRRRAP